jgi:hypothetical protein
VGPYCVLRVAYCVLRIACCVLRIACCVLRVACCVLRVACCVVACCVLRGGVLRVAWWRDGRVMLERWLGVRPGSALDHIPV